MLACTTLGGAATAGKAIALTVSAAKATSTEKIFG
jgi:hypothetical protein